MYNLLTTKIIVAALAATFGHCTSVHLQYWPDTTDCTGRMETLTVNEGTCNTGNVIHSYKVTGCVQTQDGISDLRIYIDGSGCVGNLAGYASFPCNQDIGVCKSAPSGGGSVYATIVRDEVTISDGANVRDFCEELAG